MKWKPCTSKSIHLRTIRLRITSWPRWQPLLPCLFIVLASLASAQQPALATQETSANGIGNNWLSYHGDYTGRRYSSLQQITPDNIAQLQLKWVFHSRKARVLGATPVVVGGVIYLTASNDLFAIDGRTGAMLWHHTRQESASAKEDESAHINRGVAVLNNSLFMETDDAHLLALDARSGNVLWDLPLAESNPGYGAVSAPLAARNKIILEASRSNEPQTHSLVAFDAATGKEIWTFGKQPASRPSTPPNPHAEAPPRRGESGMPGTYDPALDLLFWQTAGPSCASSATAQSQEEKHVSCLLALDSNTGKMKWQSTLPGHHLAPPALSGVPVLVDTVFQGAPRKLILAVDSNELIDIFDRETGKLLEQSNSDAMKSSGSNCAEDSSSSDWNPPSYSEQTHLFYLMSTQDCRAGSVPDDAMHPAPSAKPVAGTSGSSTLLAYDPAGDRAVWKMDSAATGHAPTGVMTTASGLLFFGGKAQTFQAADASTGQVLWSFSMGQSPTGSPMSYAIEDSQYFALAAGNDLFVFGLP